jgi:hypothetical protein
VPSHSLVQRELKTITPEALVNYSSNELVQLWKDDLNLDIWNEIGKAAKCVAESKSISPIDKLDALGKVGELVLKIKRAGTQEKGGAVTVHIVIMNGTSGVSDGRA